MNKQRIWFIIAVVVQLLILAAVPAQKIRIRKTGKLVTLKTAPVDPYSIMSGYYVTLTYDISRPFVPTGPPWSQPDHKPDWFTWPDSKPIWVVLKEGHDQIWYAHSIHQNQPQSPPDGSVIIKGKKKHHRILYAIESYFIPENARDKVESDLRTYPDQARAEVKIDARGNAALIKLLIQDRVYEY
jgi:uncharacterized membrane-anchored protein